MKALIVLFLATATICPGETLILFYKMSEKQAEEFYQSSQNCNNVKRQHM